MNQPFPVSILGALLLVSTIGGAVGLLATRIPAARKLNALASVAIGVTGAVSAGFILPQFGVPVSKSFFSGLVMSVLGAALLLAALRSFRN